MREADAQIRRAGLDTSQTAPLLEITVTFASRLSDLQLAGQADREAIFAFLYGLVEAGMDAAWAEQTARLTLERQEEEEGLLKEALIPNPGDLTRTSPRDKRFKTAHQRKRDTKT